MPRGFFGVDSRWLECKLPRPGIWDWPLSFMGMWTCLDFPHRIRHYTIQQLFNIATFRRENWIKGKKDGYQKSKITKSGSRSRCGKFDYTSSQVMKYAKVVIKECEEWREMIMAEIASFGS